VMMGLSVGWGDQYSASTNFQWIDITGLPNGRYRLTATADPGHLVKESSYANNSAWARIRITDASVAVLRYGPGA
jgi:Lysyl oxidase